MKKDLKEKTKVFSDTSIILANIYVIPISFLV
jgi:hypothetical protein